MSSLLYRALATPLTPPFLVLLLLLALLVLMACSRTARCMWRAAGIAFDPLTDTVCGQEGCVRITCLRPDVPTRRLRAIATSPLVTSWLSRAQRRARTTTDACVGALELLDAGDGGDGSVTLAVHAVHAVPYGKHSPPKGGGSALRRTRDVVVLRAEPCAVRDHTVVVSRTGGAGGGADDNTRVVQRYVTPSYDVTEVQAVRACGTICDDARAPLDPLRNHDVLTALREAFMLTRDDESSSAKRSAALRVMNELGVRLVAPQTVDDHENIDNVASALSRHVFLLRVPSAVETAWQEPEESGVRLHVRTLHATTDAPVVARMSTGAGVAEAGGPTTHASTLLVYVPTAWLLHLGDAVLGCALAQFQGGAHGHA